MQREDLSLSEKRERALALGAEQFGVEHAYVQARTDDPGTDRIVASVGSEPEPFPEGTTVERERTYCRRTVTQGAPLALSDAADQGWADHPAYREHGLGCYLGAPVLVDGETYGTVCFVSGDPRDTPFTHTERAFVEVLARLLGRETGSATDHRHGRESDGQDRTDYGELVELSPDAAFLADAETGDIVAVNDRATDLTGYTASELRSMTALDLHPEEDRRQYERLFERGATESPQDQFDDGTTLSIRRADGSDVPIEMSVDTIERGDRMLRLGTARDISTRRERDRELARTREFFEQTQETVDVGGWKVDLRSDTLQWTDEIYRIHDLPTETEITIEEALEFYHPEDRPAITDAFEKLVSEGEPYDLELRLVTAENRTRWVRATGTPQYDERGEEVVGAYGVFQDITERKERERDLRIRSRAIDESTVGVTIADASREDMPLVYVNAGFETLTGYPKEEVLGENCRFLQGEATDEETVAEIRAAIEAEEPIRTRILNYRTDGTPFWNKLTIAPVTGREGADVTHFVGIQEDVTAEMRRDRLIEVLDRVLRHNLRNDVTAIGGLAGEIADRADGECARLATRIEDVAVGLTELSEKARELEATVRETESIGPRDVVRDVRAAIMDLRTEYPDTEFTLSGPEQERVMATRQLRLALRELGENAAKHGGGSPVRYQVEAVDSETVAVHVHDSGPGLPDSERRLLEGGRETPLQHGLGLGLWLVNWIVTDLGGEVTTTTNGGTTVTVYLPQESDRRSTRPWINRNAAFSTSLE